MPRLWNASADALKSVEQDNPFFGNLLCGAFGGQWRDSSKYEDMMLHIDIFYSYDGVNEYGIDIKTMAKIQRHDAAVNADIQYIQVTNKVGTEGALYGKAKYFGFINSNGHLLTPLTHVRRFYDEMVDHGNIVHKNPRKENILYQREYRNSDGVLVCPPEKSFMMRYKDLYWLSDYTFDAYGRPIELAAHKYGEKWVEYYIATLKKEAVKRNWGAFNTLYDRTEEIFENFKKEFLQ